MSASRRAAERRIPRTYDVFRRRLLPATDRPKRVLVLGAGMAGLSAAYQLTLAGHDVAVIEARDEPGGRVRTLRAPFAGGMHAEAGAMFINGHHTLTIGYIDLLDLELVPIVRRGGALAYMRGKRIVDADRRGTRWPVRLSADERGLGLEGLWNRYLIPFVQRHLGDPRTRGFPPPSLEWCGEMSGGDFLRSQGASAGALEILKVGYLDLTGNGLYCVSALTMLRDLTAFVDGIPPLASGFSVDGRGNSPLDRKIRVQGAKSPESIAQIRGQEFSIVGGNDRLPHHLAATKELRSRITYGAPVVRIRESGKRIRVTTSGARGRREWEGDQVICTIPFPVLRQLDVDLPMERNVRRVIDRLPYTTVVRQYVQTSSRPWLKWNRTGIAIADLGVMYVNDQSITQGGKRGILESYSSGPRARAWAVLPERARRRELARQIDLLYPGTGRTITAHAMFDWDEEPYARGAYATFEPGQMHWMLAACRTGIGRLHFAGDHCSSLPGWIQGAIESGHDAAVVVHRAR